MSAIEPPTRAQFVADQLRRMIVSGELPAGTRLRQVEIAERFSVSTTPVREAFTALAREGLVRHDTHRGVIVFLPTLDDLRQNYEIRIALEPLATQIAAKAITEEDLSRLDALLEKMRGTVEGRRAWELNREFHRIIYAAAHRELLVRIIEQLRDAAEAYIQLVSDRPPPDYFDAVAREHQEIVDALRARAPARAHKAMANHLRHSLEVIGSLLPG